MVWPAAATCRRILHASSNARRSGEEQLPRRQSAASAASTAGVLRGHGPSSKVSTTSPGCRKSCSSKCSNPKPGPSVVSISTVRDTPSASGPPRHTGAAATATGASVLQPAARSTGGLGGRGCAAAREVADPDRLAARQRFSRPAPRLWTGVAGAEAAFGVGTLVAVAGAHKKNTIPKLIKKGPQAQNSYHHVTHAHPLRPGTATALVASNFTEEGEFAVTKLGRTFGSSRRPHGDGCRRGRRAGPSCAAVGVGIDNEAPAAHLVTSTNGGVDLDVASESRSGKTAKAHCGRLRGCRCAPGCCCWWWRASCRSWPSASSTSTWNTGGGCRHRAADSLSRPQHDPGGRAGAAGPRGGAAGAGALPTLGSGNLAAFRTRSQGVIAQQFPGSNRILLQEDGQQLMNTLLPPDAPLPVRPNLELLRRAFATGAPAVSDLYMGAIGPRPVVAIDVPVKRDDGSGRRAVEQSALGGFRRDHSPAAAARGLGGIGFRPPRHQCGAHPQR